MLTMHDLVHDLARSVMVHEVLDATNNQCTGEATVAMHCLMILASR